MPITLILIIAYFVLLWLLSWMKIKVVPGRTIYFLRGFFPSWKFFEDAGDVPVLWIRCRLADAEWSDWNLGIEKIERTWSTLLVNAEGNSLLAYGSLLQHLMSELEEIEDPMQLEKNVSYLLTKNLVCHELQKKASTEDAVSYQFKISTFDSISRKILMDEILISPIYHL